MGSYVSIEDCRSFMRASKLDVSEGFRLDPTERGGLETELAKLRCDELLKPEALDWYPELLDDCEIVGE
jgi:hypothetical protein